MVGYEIDVTKMTKDEAVNYILNHCNRCEKNLQCSDEESAKCNGKFKYLLKRFSEAK